MVVREDSVISSGSSYLKGLFSGGLSNVQIIHKSAFATAVELTRKLYKKMIIILLFNTNVL